MKVKCSHCNTSYSVDDAKVTGKKFGFDCPKCGTNVVIDNRAREEAPVSPIPETFPDNDLSTAFPSDIPAPDLSASAPSDMDFLNGGTGSTFSLEDMSGSESAVQEPQTQIDEDFEPEIDLSVLQNVNTGSSSQEEDLLSSDLSAGIPEEDLSLSSFSEPLPVEEVPSLSVGKAPEAEEDENITIDLDSLDIDLAEPEEMAASGSVSAEETEPDFESEKIIIDEAALSEASAPVSSHPEDDDESITLDLDSLDIPLEESGAVSEGISASSEEDDSRLSLDDAGISFDEVSEEPAVDLVSSKEDDFHLTLDEIDDSINIEDINRFTEPSSELSLQPEEPVQPETPIYESMQDKPLPEVDIDRFSTVSAFARETEEDRFLDIEESQNPEESFSRDYSEDQIASVGGGYVDFSVDYALHYSRLKAVLRLFGIYNIIFIPHVFVMLIYSLVAGIINFFNLLITLFSGSRERDFSLLQENYLRYSISLFSSAVNITEEYPAFGGRKNIDSQVQMNIVYPAKNSRVLAFLRLTGIGIFLTALPHLILLTILSVGMTLISFFSLIFVIFAGKWPSIMFDFMVRYLRYLSAVSAYTIGLVDTYPSFRFE
jgi:predicted Zn finger-like uncharacterized protein